MFNTIPDFMYAWKAEKEASLKIFNALTDDALSQIVFPGGRTLGKIANHLIETLTEMASAAGLPIEHETPDYQTARELLKAYKKTSDILLHIIQQHWTDHSLQEKVMMYHNKAWKKGFVLAVLVLHQAHHRGQMTVLMRQAGLKVPGVYGPAKEEWQAFNLQPQE